MSKQTCPSCGQLTAPAHAPFCGRGCKDRDLLNWLSEGYAIPGRSDEAEALDTPEPRA